MVYACNLPNETLELDPKNGIKWHFKAFSLMSRAIRKGSSDLRRALRKNPKDVTKFAVQG